MAFDLPIDSRYRNTPAIIIEGAETLSKWVEPAFLDSAPVETIIATTAVEGRVDLISDQFLGSPKFAWAIIAYNRKTDINWPKAGDQVRIPVPELVFDSA